MEKLFLYSENDNLNKNFDLIKTLGYNCVTIKECPNISEYLIKKDIKKCICIVMIENVYDYVLSNSEYIKSDNYTFVYYTDLHPIVDKGTKSAKITESLRLISNSPNAYMYGGVFYTMKLYHGFFPKEKIIHDIYYSVDDEFIEKDESISGMDMMNNVLVFGSFDKSFYPARNKMLALSETNSEIICLQSDIDKYTELLKGYLCCFTCSMCNYTPYLIQSIFEIPASGSLLLAHDNNVKEHMKKLGFIDGENYISCTIENILEKVKYICDPLNRKEVDRIRFNGYKLICNRHKKSHRMVYLDKIISSITYNCLYGNYKCHKCNIIYRKAPSVSAHNKLIHTNIIGLSENLDSIKMDKYCMPSNYVNQLKKPLNLDKDSNLENKVNDVNKTNSEGKVNESNNEGKVNESNNEGKVNESNSENKVNESNNENKVNESNSENKVNVVNDASENKVEGKVNDVKPTNSEKKIEKIVNNIDEYIDLYQYIVELIQTNKFTKIINIGSNPEKITNFEEDIELIKYDKDNCINYMNSNTLINKYIEEHSYNEKNVSIDNSYSSIFLNYFRNVKSNKRYTYEKNCDIVVICQVIECLLEPDDLIKFIKSFNAKYYIISTKCRNVIYKQYSSRKIPVCANGPPINTENIREWTFIEFQMYLKNYFKVIDSFLGRNKTECQWHLCEKYDVE